MLKHITNNYKFGTIIGLLLILVAITVFTPIIKNALILLGLGFILIAFVLIHSTDESYRRNSILVIYVYLYLWLCSFYYLIDISSVGIGALVMHMYFFFLILLMLIIPHALTEKQKKWVFWGVTFIVSLNILDNIRLCIAYPELFFLVSRDKDPMGAILNMGGSKFYNAIFFFFTISFFGFLNCNNKRNKYLLFGSVALTSIFIFGFCLKAAVLLFTCLSAVLLYFAKRAKNFKRFISLILIPSLLGFIVLSAFSDLIIEIIANLFSSERLVQRLVLLIDPDESQTGTVEAREYLWLMSIDTWLDNPVNFLFGIGDHRANWDAGQSASDTGIGQHSDFLDSLARYGLIGGFVLIMIIFRSFKYLLSIYDKKYRLQLYVIFLLFILFGFTKGVFHPDIGFILFVFLPLMTVVINKENKQIV